VLGALSFQLLRDFQEHLAEVDRLHDSLGRGQALHKVLRKKDDELSEIQRNMNEWKDQTTEKLAKKFQAELARELDKYILAP
jgi:hypothetical protein